MGYVFKKFTWNADEQIQDEQGPVKAEEYIVVKNTGPWPSQRPKHAVIVFDRPVDGRRMWFVKNRVRIDGPRPEHKMILDHFGLERL